MPSAVFTKGNPICAIPVGVPRQLIKQLFQNVIMVWMCNVPRRLVCLDIVPMTGGAILEGCLIFWRRSLAGGGGPWGRTLRFSILAHFLPALCFLPGSWMWEGASNSCHQAFLTVMDCIPPLLHDFRQMFYHKEGNQYKYASGQGLFKKLALKRVLAKIQIIRRQISMMGQGAISPERTDMASVNLRDCLHFEFSL